MLFGNLKICVVIITQGGGVAAPVGGQILSEVLPYLEVIQGNPDEVEEKIEVTMPNIIGKTIDETEKILKDKGLQLILNNEESIDKTQVTIKNQIPQAGIIAYQGSSVYVEY